MHWDHVGVRWDLRRVIVAETAADYSDLGRMVAGCTLVVGIGLGHIAGCCSLDWVHRNNQLDPEGYLHRRHRIDRLADHAENLPAAGVHRNSLGLAAHIQQVHRHIEERETGNRVGRTAVVARNSETDRTAGLEECSQEPEMSN